MVKPVRVCSVSIEYAERTVDENIALALKRLETAVEFSPDIVCLPELLPFTGVPIEKALKMAEPIPGSITECFAKVAKEKGFWITVGTFEKNGNKFHNSCFVLDKTGQLQGVYRKMFPTLGELEAGVIPGQDNVVLDTPWGKIGFAICFDMNFHEVMNGLGRNKASLVIFPTYFHAGMINSSRCITNSYYIVCARIMGADRKQGGFIVDPLGNFMKSASLKNPVICENINLDFVIAHQNWNLDRLKKMKKKYGKEVSIDTADLEELVKVTSWVKDKSAEDIAAEFGVELLREYLFRARDLRQKALR